MTRSSSLTLATLPQVAGDLFPVGDRRRATGVRRGHAALPGVATWPATLHLVARTLIEGHAGGAIGFAVERQRGADAQRFSRIRVERRRRTVRSRCISSSAWELDSVDLKLVWSAGREPRELRAAKPGIFLTKFPSLQRRGGCGINQKSRSLRSAADGVVSSERYSGLNVPAELTTPSAPLWNGTIF